MAYATLFVTVLMMAAANARFKPFWENDDSSSSNFPGMSYKYVTPLPLPQFPGFPNMNLPTPPPLMWPSNFPSPSFPTFTMPEMPKLPTVEDIMNLQSQPGSNVVGGAVISSSQVSRGKDGEVIRKGGSTIVTSNNGKVIVSQVGDAPPVKVYTNDNNEKPFPLSDTLKFNNFKPFEFPSFHMEPITFKPIEPINVDIIRNHVPGNNENFSGSSHSVSSFSSNNNGVVSSGGASQSVQNDNGKVDETNLAFESNPKE